MHSSKSLIKLVDFFANRARKTMGPQYFGLCGVMLENRKKTKILSISKLIYLSKFMCLQNREFLSRTEVMKKNVQQSKCFA